MVDNIQFLREQLVGLQKKYQQIEKTNLKLNEKLLEIYSLYKISLTLSSTFNLQQILKSIRDIFKSTFNVDQFSLMLFDEHFQNLTLKSSFGLSPEFEKIENFAAHNDIFQKAIKEAKPIYVRNMTRYPNFRFHSDIEQASGSFLSIPLLADDNQPVGLLNVHRPEVNAFSRHDLNLLKRICTQIAKVIDKTLLFTQTRELSITDELTAIYNRRYFNQRYEREILRAKRYGRSLAVVILDIDHFKNYNDTHGHLMGDEVLVQFARIMDSIIRKADILARYGGEEFVILLPEIEKEQAILAAEKFRKTIEKHLFPGGETQPNGRLTISLGIASFPDDASDAKNLLAQADKALYIAKKRSRNAVGYCCDPAKKAFEIYSPPATKRNGKVSEVANQIERTVAVG